MLNPFSTKLLLLWTPLQILNEHPTYPAVRSTSMPWPRTLLEHNLSHLRSSPSFVLPTLQIMGNRSMLSSLKSWQARISSTTTSTTLYTKSPTNQYLLDCLLCGSSLKLGLVETTEMYSTIVDGLKAPRWRRRITEVMVVGSCIQLLLSGPSITTEYAGPYKKSPKEVAEKLKA